MDLAIPSHWTVCGAVLKSFGARNNDNVDCSSKMSGRPVTNRTPKKAALITSVLNTEFQIAKLILVIHLNKH